MQSEDRDFLYWLDYFSKKEPSLSEFIVALEQKDTYFLNNEIMLDYNDELYDKVYPSGFIESDFININKDGDDESKVYFYTRVALYLYSGLNLTLLKKRVSQQSFVNFIGNSLINGRYEEFNIEFHQIMTVLFKNKIVSMDSLMDWGFLHGTRLGESYGEDYSKNTDLLKKQKAHRQQIESIKLIGIKNPINIQRMGDTGSEWLDED